MGTAKGFTGQYADALTGLDYYNARYYDPVAGVFLSADSVQGNLQGMNPYAYVGGNPETSNDPTGNYFGGIPLDENGGAVGYVNYSQGTITTFQNNGGHNTSDNRTWSDEQNRYVSTHADISYDRVTFQQVHRYGGYNPLTDSANSTGAKLSQMTHFGSTMEVLNNPHASFWDKAGAVWDFLGTNANNAFQLCAILCGGEGEVADAGVAAVEEGTTEGGSLLEEAAQACGEGLSFTPTTKVATKHGKEDIGTLKVGEQVWAYNPATHKMEFQPIEHVWINHDNDLVDLTITATTPGKQDKAGHTSREVIHTTKKHPFLTTEHGFVAVGHLKVGMHVVRADGQVEVITGWKVVAGSQTMYNLEVAHDHTYTVGTGQWVVHNCGITGEPNPANEVAGQQNLYEGQQYDSEALHAQGYKVSSGGRKFGFQKSEQFSQYLREQGQTSEQINNWEYTMEVWTKRGAPNIENHFWRNMWNQGFEDLFFHHH